MFLSNVKSNQSSSTPGLPRCVFQAGSNADTNESRFLSTTAAATEIAHPSDARGQLHVSRPLHAQLSLSFLPIVCFMFFLCAFHFFRVRFMFFGVFHVVFMFFFCVPCLCFFECSMFFGVFHVFFGVFHSFVCLVLLCVSCFFVCFMFFQGA